MALSVIERLVLLCISLYYGIHVLVDIAWRIIKNPRTLRKVEHPKKIYSSSCCPPFDDNVLNEDEVLAYFLEITRKSPQFFHQDYDRIEHQIQEMSTAQFKSEFRFSFSELPLLTEALQLPDMFVCCNGSVASGYEGLLLLLRRLTYPCRLSDLIPRFGRSVPEMSLILAEVIDHISNEKGYLLRRLDQPWLRPQNIQREVFHPAFPPSLVR